MTPPQDKPKKVPLGKSIVWPEEQIDELARITEADIEAGKELWNEGAPKQYKKLLDAQPDEVDT